MPACKQGSGSKQKRAQKQTAITRKQPLPGADSKGRRAFLFRLQKGSLVAEAALVLPLFFFCVVTLIGFLEMYRSSMLGTVRLQQQAEELGQLAAVTGSFTEEIDLYESLSWGGGWPRFFGGSPGIACRAHVRPWTGRSEEEGGTAPTSDGDRLVYVTEYQSVYHTDSRCTHLTLQITAVGRTAAPTLTNDYGAHYHACEKCAKGSEAPGLVYITPEGDCYHYAADCSGLTRTVRMERLSSLEGLPLCSRCAAHAEEGT